MNTERAASKAKLDRRLTRRPADQWAYVWKSKADARAKQLVLQLTAGSKSGAGSYRILARALVAAGVPAPRRGFWTALAAKRLSDRLRCREASKKQTMPAEGSSITRRLNYREFSETVRPHLRDATATGAESLNGIARYLNRNEVRSHNGQLWSPSKVLHLRRVLKQTE
jgi:hypothetical protein